MMTRLLSILLLLTLVLHAGSSWVQIGWFYTNQDAIIEQSCVNKNRPVLKCEGKCVLAEKLKQAESASHTPATPELRLLPFFTIEESIVHLPVYVEIPKLLWLLIPDYAEPVRAIFHPPPFLS